MPRHEWNGTELRFEIEPGQCGNYVDLKGPAGRASYGAGPLVLPRSNSWQPMDADALDAIATRIQGHVAMLMQKHAAEAEREFVGRLEMMRQRIAELEGDRIAALIRDGVEAAVTTKH